jgi:glycosyltransferase involved in cell wall biosynthesis
MDKYCKQDKGKELRITFFANNLTHHQIPFSESLFKLIGNNYTFVAMKELSKERKQMGWRINDTFTYELRAYESDKLLEKANNLAVESDIVILGSAPDVFIKNRLKMGKLTFKYSERLYKKGLSAKNFPRAAVSSYLHHGQFQKYPIYMLCASAYLAADLSIFGNYKNRTFKWGYFPETKKYDIEKLIVSKRSNNVKVLWVGRFIDWKHPEHALAVAQRLDNANIKFKLKMIGNGEEYNKIRNMADSMHLKNSVEFLGAIPYEEVRRHMEKANIYIITSDFNEGWGAVLNESMNSGCAVVASHAIGAVPFLLKHGENGLIYKNDDVDDLCNKVISLARDIELCEILGRNAYLTIKNTWNAEVAADRFIKLSESLLSGRVSVYKDGPCSRAIVIKNNWFNGGNNNDFKGV